MGSGSELVTRIGNAAANLTVALPLNEGDLDDEIKYPDEAVEQLRDHGHTLQKAGWRLVCSCDAQIWRRHDLRLSRGGRGNKDVEGKNKVKLISQFAEAHDTSYSTIRRNTEIHTRFFSGADKERVASIEHSLPDKGYYVAALETKDPVAALEKMAAAKARDARFSPKDAERMAKSLMNNLATPESYADMKRHLYNLRLAVTTFLAMWDSKDFSDELVVEKTIHNMRKHSSKEG